MQDEVTLPIDPEPFTLRLTLVGVLIFTVIASYILINRFIDAGSFSIIGLFGAIIVSAGVLYLIESPLKKNWPTKRFVTLKDDTIHVKDGEKIEREIDPQQQVNVFTWYFIVERRSRVPKGHYVIAIALEQDDLYIPVYTIMSPAEYETSALEFDKLQSKKKMGNDLRVAGQLRRLHMAEAARGLDGVEMLPEDFLTYHQTLKAKYNRWMP